MATSGVEAVTLDPWHEPRIPLEEQYRSWKQRIKAPYDKHEVDAYTRTRVILMNGVEVGAWNFSHHFARSTDDFELRSLLARSRMVDQQQQTTIKLKIKATHAAPMDKRNLLEGAKLPSAQPTPTSRTSSPSR